MKNKTIINPETGAREDKTDYPITAVREVIINALVHRDYSIHTEGMPIQIAMYEDRMEIRNPGDIIAFCKTPRTRKEICEYLVLSSVSYAIQTHVMPLVESGQIKLTIPEKPKSPKQLFYSE